MALPFLFPLVIINPEITVQRGLIGAILAEGAVIVRRSPELTGIAKRCRVRPTLIEWAFFKEEACGQPAEEHPGCRKG